MYTITIPEESDNLVSFAAEELQKYLYKIYTEKFTILKEENGYKGSIIISVDKSCEGAFRIEYRNQSVHIQANKTANIIFAAYKFLEIIGCRFFAPDFFFYKGKHEFIPRKKKINFESIPSITLIENFSIRITDIHPGETLEECIENTKKIIDWNCKIGKNFIRMNIAKWENVRNKIKDYLIERGQKIIVAGHNWSHFLSPDKYFEEHPDWFASINGIRVKDSDKSFCISNKKALQTFALNVVAYLKNREEIETIHLWPPDCDEKKWCQCSECLKIKNPSDKVLTVINFTADYVKKLGIKTKIGIIAYWDYIFPPSHNYKDNVSIEFCDVKRSYKKPIFRSKHPDNIRILQAIGKWAEYKGYKGKKVYYSYYRKWSWHSFPFNTPFLMSKELTWYKKNGMEGVSIYGVPADWRAYELQHYLFAKMAFEGCENVNKMLTDYCKVRFNAKNDSLKKLKKFFTLLEKTILSVNSDGTKADVFWGYRMDQMIYLNMKSLKKALNNTEILSSILENNKSDPDRDKYFYLIQLVKHIKLKLSAVYYYKNKDFKEAKKYTDKLRRWVINNKTKGLVFTGEDTTGNILTEITAFKKMINSFIKN